MGATGVGKSTFVNLVSNSNLPVGSGLASCTAELQVSEPFMMDGKIVTLIDTPGFDDAVKTEAEILRLIADFLAKTYENGRKLSGVIFLHRISDQRMGGVARKNFRLFRKLCGDDALKHIIIATTMWGGVSAEIGARREAELSTKDQFFKLALDKGAKLVRHDNTLQSAQNILREITGYLPQALSIQTELVDEHKDINETAAGMDLKADLEARIGKQHMELNDIKTEMNRLLAVKDEKHRAELEELTTSLLEVRQQLAAAEDERSKLHEKHDVSQKEQEEKTMQLMAAMEKKERQLRELQSRVSQQTQAIEALQASLASAEEKVKQGRKELEAVIVDRSGPKRPPMLLQVASIGAVLLWAIVRGRH
ncbi:hypothetical protein QCA50_002199 [Cerrena zonata]|uniref:G domain-containing protein n=1 Tax=Cerrena zonata TaxID=2478898 RepID=A0AAW0GYP6_9APHY